jgi:hypothetical protein
MKLALDVCFNVGQMRRFFFYNVLQVKLLWLSIYFALSGIEILFGPAGESFASWPKELLPRESMYACLAREAASIPRESRTLSTLFLIKT